MALEEYSCHLFFYVTFSLAASLVNQWDVALCKCCTLFFLGNSSTVFFAYNVIATYTKLTFHQEPFPPINLKSFVFETICQDHDFFDLLDIPSFDVHLPLHLPDSSANSF